MTKLNYYNNNSLQQRLKMNYLNSMEVMKILKYQNQINVKKREEKVRKNNLKYI